MTSQKFDKLKKGEYVKDYFEKDKLFYDAIKVHLLKAVGKRKTIGIDVGAGPGIGAKILNSLKINTVLTGYEPSKTAEEGKKLSKGLNNSKSTTKYIALKKNIKEIQTPKENSLDYILILRAAHEIAESLGTKDSFFSEIKRLVIGLKKSGIVIVADPQYAKEFIDKKEIIQRVMKYQKKTMEHSHVPSGYINNEEMISSFKRIGLKLVKQTKVPNNHLLEWLNKQGYNLTKSPTYFYILTFQKE